MGHEILIDPNKTPDVLLLGNGFLRLAGGGDWTTLLKQLQTKSAPPIRHEGIPFAMLPECLCGTNVEDVQRKTAASLQTGTSHPLLKQILQLPFDAILTTNYTYEIEETLTGKSWASGKERKKAFTALDGNTKVHHNTCICNLITTEKGHRIPVFHIHGELFRKHSLTLSYYSYANAVSKLIIYNKKCGNSFQEHQQTNSPLKINSWIDYFLLGNVYSVGFGFDLSEFDLWWAIERKAREKANHGDLYAYLIDEPTTHLPQEVLLSSMRAVPIRVSNSNGFNAAYESIISDLSMKVIRANQES